MRISCVTITDVTGSGIYLRSNNQPIDGAALGTSRVEATIRNNIIEEVGQFTFGGINAIVGGSGAGDTGQMGLVTQGNSVNLDNTSGLDGDNNAIILDQISSSARYYVPGYAGSGQGEFAFSGGAGTASANLGTYWAGVPHSNTLVNGEFPNHAGGGVDAVNVISCNENACVALPDPGGHGVAAAGDTAN